MSINEALRQERVDNSYYRAKADIDRLVKVMLHVATHTRDKWARDYLCTRLEELGFKAELNDPVQTYEEKDR